MVNLITVLTANLLTTLKTCLAEVGDRNQDYP
jgi:hypothetical protein